LGICDLSARRGGRGRGRPRLPDPEGALPAL